jgi:hypothetical protein
MPTTTGFKAPRSHSVVDRRGLLPKRRRRLYQQGELAHLARIADSVLRRGGRPDAAGCRAVR